MRLKQIKLAGFKSFVDATTVTLPGNRCAVVGPNGCGKSNIIDAVRWVMGESSAKQLRGENLTDVIFNGSNTRKPNNAASIELIFDNSDGRIGGEYAAYADIAIRREVSRDGQSNYLLNGTRCRRRDIQDIFLGTGFGPRSYSIIEQGMISQLVEAKPEELRVYLEEAAGISKYKERRRETHNRIKHTRENLERINDIREELGRQLDRLQRQAQAAERYRTLKTEESLLNAQLYVLRYQALKEGLGQREQKIAALEVDLEKAIAEQRHVEAQIEGQRKGFSEQTENVNGVQERFYKLGSQITHTEESLQFNRRRLVQLNEELERARKRSAEANQQVTSDDEQIQRMQAEVAELQPQAEALATADQSVQGALADLENQNKQWQQRWDSFNQEFSANEQEAQVQTSRIEYLQQLIARLNNRAQELTRLASDQPKQEGQLVEQMALEIDGLETQSRSLDELMAECREELSVARQATQGLEQSLESARGQVQELRQQSANLQAIQDAALGSHVPEAENWISDNDLSSAQRLGQNLSVVPGWEGAVESVLGRFMQALQVDDLTGFAGTLSQLAEGDLALVESRATDAVDARNEALALPTVRSLLRDRSLAGSSLLYGVFAAESAEVALSKRQQLAPGQSIITREGFWVGPDWMRALHDADQTQGIIERGRAIESLALEIEEAEAQLATLVDQRQEARVQVETLEAKREELQRQANELNQSLSDRRTDHGVTRVKLEEAAARQEQLRKESAEVAEQLAQEKSRQEQTRSALAIAETVRSEQSVVKADLTEQREQMGERLQRGRDSARASRDKFHAVNVRLESVQSQLTVSLTARERVRTQQSQLADQMKGVQQGIEESQRPIPELETQLKEQLASRVGVEEELKQARANLETLESGIRALEAQRGKVSESVAKVREGLEDERVQRQGMAVQENNVLEQLGATGHELEVVQQGMPEEASETAWVEEIERMSRRIQRLGAINLAAIEEFDTESERKNYLDAQAADLEEALDTLLDVMQKIDKETRVRFKETFDAVNTKLGELFPKVFGGGSATLELTGDDMLDTGVTLMARPPGKKNSSIHLLSGGEKAMTAVALIFAIFHLNPSPVCLLDEVDAPLDDMNVTRFAALIREMSESVQFLVITHNKITMEMADYLMGVTMHEAGVSRLVSVDVDAAAALAIA
ncbi:MAG: chromosome segregation protein SMC [Candidatus Azotimanducaceae bacterium]